MQDIGQNMLKQIGLAFPVNRAQFFYSCIQSEKFFGDVLMVREKMPHLIRQFRVNRPFLWKPVAGLVLFLSQYMKVNSHKFIVYLPDMVDQLFRKS